MKTSVRGIFKVNDDTYRIKVSLGKSLTTGKYDALYETIRGDFADAKKRLHKLQSEHDRGVLIKPGKATLAEYLQSWLSDYVRPNLSARTCELYSYIANKHIIPTIGRCPLVDLKPQHVQHLYAEKQNAGLSNRTVQLIYVTLHKAIKNAVKTGLLSRNIVEAVECPKIQRHEMKIMSESDIHLFLEMARNSEYYTLFYCYLFTGARRSELLAVRWQDFEPLLCQLSITRSMQYLANVELDKRISFKAPKTQKSRRMIALSPSTVAVLQEHRAVQDKQRQELVLPVVTESDLIFSHYDGSPLLPGSVTHAWMKLARRSGLAGVRLHDARHSHASLMLKQGVSPKVISERLGHAGISITLDLYAHVSPGMQTAAAAKFDDIMLPKVKDSN